MADEQTRVAVISIIIENTEKIGEINAVLHDYGDLIIGRMGLPYKPKNIFMISIAIDAPQDDISALAGKIGRISGVTTKTVFANIP